MRADLAFGLASLWLTGAAYAECLPGKYPGSGGEADQTPFPVLITITCSGDAVAGQVESPFGIAPILRGETAQDRWSIEAEFDGQPLSVEATLRDGEWHGAYVLGGSTGQLQLRRDDTATFAAMSAEAPVRTDLTTEEWRADLAALAREIPTRHANAFHTIDPLTWTEAAAAADERLPTLSATTAPVALRELAARIGDGHTAVRLPEARRLPIGMFWFGDELRIVETDAAHAELLGARVLRIGDRSAHDARRTAQRLMARENRWADLAATPYLLRREDVLTYFGMVEPGAGARLRVRLADGARRDVTLAFADDFEATAHVGGAPPIWRQRPDEGLWWQELAGGVFYINFRTYDQLRTRSAQLFAELDRLQPARIVVDMRDNGGGDFTVFRESILAAIRERPWLNRRDRLYVLIGREMFSAAMSNAADLHLQTNATLVGEPIGERPNSYQEVRFFALPNSGLRVGVSVEYYEALPGAGNPDAIEPDVSRPPTWWLFSRGQDDALEWIRSRG